MSGLTYVSAFLALSEDRTALRSFDTYIHHFKKLAATGVNIYLFLNSAVPWVHDYPNVYIEYIEFEDLSTYRKESSLPAIRTAEKDTHNYLILINAKPEFVYRAIQSKIFPASHYYWIDFGIFHVIQDTEAAQKYLTDLVPRPLGKGLVIPGCWQKGEYNYFDRICWRFCGGVFAGDRETLLSFYETVHQEFRKQQLTWEVNFWAYLESKGMICPQWIQADHNDTIVRLPDSFFV
jgi:hypothetical protein